jgi:hypothetical protein
MLSAMLGNPLKLRGGIGSFNCDVLPVLQAVLLYEK